MRNPAALAVGLCLATCSPHAGDVTSAPARSPGPPAVGFASPSNAPDDRAGQAPPHPSFVAASSVPEPSASTIVAVVDPVELRQIEAAGFDFARLAVGIGARTTRELRAVPAFHQLFAALDGDIRAAAAPFPLARVTSVDGFRQFDAHWLASDEMTFALAGVFNRLDRRPFYEGQGTCGEVRFVYRLSYTTVQGGKPMASRLPMTVNVVFFVEDAPDATAASCVNAARLWQVPGDLRDAARTNFLLEAGPLGASARKAWRLKSIETNVQTFRLQSSVHPSMAGHIEYDLRVFHPDARGVFRPAPMENMPDVRKLERDSRLRADLLAHLERPEVLADIDRGTLQLPERFLATQATSFSPRGLTRAHNRPFRRLFEEKDFSGLRLDGFSTIRSPKALLRRLDGASCVGCHQSRSIAGFHHVGLDDADTPAFNALFSGSSPHLTADLERRRAYVDAVASGRAPDEFRPVPERQGTDGEGASCGLGDAGFSDWTCSAGLKCTEAEDPEVGTCLTEGRIGAPCEYGKMVPSARPYRDQIASLAQHACGATQTCDTNFQGFAEGSCSAACSSHLSGSSCADFLDVDGFQNCLRAPIPVERCAHDYVFPAAMALCDADHACRQDYVCARTRQPDAGACVPPYFVFQLRLDGYPLKR